MRFQIGATKMIKASKRYQGTPAVSIVVLVASLVAVVLFVGASMFAQGNNRNVVPEIPTDLVATAVHSGMVDLDWDDVSNAESYEVQSYIGGDFEVLPHGSVDIVYYSSRAVVTGLPSEIFFLFQVRALNAAGRSG